MKIHWCKVGFAGLVAVTLISCSNATTSTLSESDQNASGTFQLRASKSTPVFGESCGAFSAKSGTVLNAVYASSLKKTGGTLLQKSDEDSLFVNIRPASLSALAKKSNCTLMPATFFVVKSDWDGWPSTTLPNPAPQAAVTPTPTQVGTEAGGVAGSAAGGVAGSAAGGVAGSAAGGVAGSAAGDVAGSASEDVPAPPPTSVEVDDGNFFSGGNVDPNSGLSLTDSPAAKHK